MGQISAGKWGDLDGKITHGTSGGGCSKGG